MTPDFSAQLVHWAQTHLGFLRVGIIPTEPAQTFPQFSEWLDHRYQADMNWLETNQRKEKRADIRNILPTGQSVITLVYTYRTSDLPDAIKNDPRRGIFARYTWGKDYHKVIKKKLLVLIKYLEEQLGDTVSARAYVDTGPILERDLAERAGLGFIGNNSMLINSLYGSYLFICEIIVNKNLAPVIYKKTGGCRTCHTCLANCPTQAIVKNKVIDARRCLSYLTIESKTSIPEQFRPLLKNNIYGCDICQEVCPWNGTEQAKQTQNDWFDAALERQAPYLTDLAQLTEATFLERFKGTPIMRVKRSGLLRNVAVALGNSGHTGHIKTLEWLVHDNDPLIREHAEWGLNRLQK
ncbi:MAG: tRNA epoxyqueuosine(34) reductase QueG [Patescibacteria group bacterium]|jgi:epoxyqueuosine reductase